MILLFLIVILQMFVIINGLLTRAKNLSPSLDFPTDNSNEVATESPEFQSGNALESDRNVKQSYSNNLFRDCYENDTLANFAMSNWRRKSEAAPQMKEWAEAVVKMVESIGGYSLEGGTVSNKFYLYTAYNEVLGDAFYVELNEFWKWWMFTSNSAVPSGEELTRIMRHLTEY